jgi:hypothetical protein
MNLKHSSWSYEKEWRIIKMRLPEEKEFTSGLEYCPLKPTAIYLGVNFDKNEVHSVKENWNQLIKSLLLIPCYHIPAMYTPKKLVSRIKKSC